MKKCFSEKQIIRVLKEAGAGAKTADLFRRISLPHHLFLLSVFMSFITLSTDSFIGGGSLSKNS